MDRIIKFKEENGTEIAYCPFPIGSVIQNVLSTFNPNTLYKGTTWERYAQGRVLVGVNENETEFDTVGKTGGAKTVTLTTNQIPSHKHKLYMWMHSGAAASGPHYGLPYKYNDGMKQETSASAQFNDNYVDYTGSGQAHSNLQPYITVYMWVRTA